MRLIKLSRTHSNLTKDLAVNLDHVQFFSESPSGTEVRFSSGDTITAKETIREIEVLIGLAEIDAETKSEKENVKVVIQTLNIGRLGTH